MLSVLAKILASFLAVPCLLGLPLLLLPPAASVRWEMWKLRAEGLIAPGLLAFSSPSDLAEIPLGASCSQPRRPSCSRKPLLMLRAWLRAPPGLSMIHDLRT